MDQPPLWRKTQFTAAEDLTTPLTVPEVKTLQQVIGVFFYNTQAVDSTIFLLVSLGSLAAAQTHAPQYTLSLLQNFMDYATCNQNPFFPNPWQDLG